MKVIVERSEELDPSVFSFLIAKLLPSFGMTRSPKFAFYGVKADKEGNVSDPKHAIRSCWRRVGKELVTLKDCINRKTGGLRNRALVDLPEPSKKRAIEKLSLLFGKLRKVRVENSEVGDVGASKVLFATFPEIALPVDNAEWKYVFRNMKYRKILKTMANEINEWERRFKPREHLERVDPNPSTVTLPAIYNVLAMSVRERDKQALMRGAQI